MNVSTKAYYRFKKMVADKGRASLKPTRAQRDSEIRELTQPQKEALIALLCQNPDFGPQRLSQALRRLTPPIRVESRLIYEHLKRKNLNTVSQRRAFAAISVDSEKPQSP